MENLQPTKSATLLRCTYVKSWTRPAEADDYHQLASRKQTGESQMRSQGARFALRNQPVGKVALGTKPMLSTVFPRRCFQLIPSGPCISHTVARCLSLPSCEMGRITLPFLQGPTQIIISTVVIRHSDNRGKSTRETEED